MQKGAYLDLRAPSTGGVELEGLRFRVRPSKKDLMSNDVCSRNPSFSKMPRCYWRHPFCGNMGEGLQAISSGLGIQNRNRRP